jgi:hypothetical protein
LLDPPQAVVMSPKDATAIIPSALNSRPERQIDIAFSLKYSMNEVGAPVSRQTNRNCL